MTLTFFTLLSHYVVVTTITGANHLGVPTLVTTLHHTRGPFIFSIVLVLHTFFCVCGYVCVKVWYFYVFGLVVIPHHYGFFMVDLVVC